MGPDNSWRSIDYPVSLLTGSRLNSRFCAKSDRFLQEKHEDPERRAARDNAKWRERAEKGSEHSTNHGEEMAKEGARGVIIVARTPALTDTPLDCIHAHTSNTIATLDHLRRKYGRSVDQEQ